MTDRLQIVTMLLAGSPDVRLDALPRLIKHYNRIATTVIKMSREYDLMDDADLIDWSRHEYKPATFEAWRQGRGMPAGGGTVA